MTEEIRFSKASFKDASKMSFKDAVKTAKAKMRTLYEKKFMTTKVMKPLADQTSDIPPSQEAAADQLDKSKVLTYEDLQYLSSNFSPENYLGRTQFGHLYKGIIPQGGWKGMRSGEVTIKTWINEQFMDVGECVYCDRVTIREYMEQEITFLQQPVIAMHPHTANVMGYCLDDNKRGVVFDLKPLHTLKKHIDDFAEDFGWVKRVDVAVKLAYVLKFFHEHEPEYIVRNLSPAHVMLDQDLNPVLIDHALIHGGSLVELPLPYGGPYGSYGYVCDSDVMLGPTRRTDVHGYGTILLEIIRQCTYNNNKESEIEKLSTSEFAWMDYVGFKEKQEEKSDGSGEESPCLYSFAHKSMRDDPDYDAVDGNKISIIGLRSVEKLNPYMGNMIQVYEALKELKIVQSHSLLLEDDED